jgi:hypothetical protein
VKKLNIGSVISNVETISSECKIYRSTPPAIILLRISIDGKLKKSTRSATAIATMNIFVWSHFSPISLPSLRLCASASFDECDGSAGLSSVMLELHACCQTTENKRLLRSTYTRIALVRLVGLAQGNMSGFLKRHSKVFEMQPSALGQSCRVP